MAVSPIPRLDALDVQTALEKLLESVEEAGGMKKTTYDSNNDSIVDNAATVNGFTVGTSVPANAVFTDDQKATEVYLAKAIDIDGDGTPETTVEAVLIGLNESLKNLQDEVGVSANRRLLPSITEGTKEHSYRPCVVKHYDDLFRLTNYLTGTEVTQENGKSLCHYGYRLKSYLSEGPYKIIEDKYLKAVPAKSFVFLYLTINSDSIQTYVECPFDDEAGFKAQLISPSNGASFPFGDSITFEAKAIGGTGNYAFTWDYLYGCSGALTNESSAIASYLPSPGENCVLFLKVNDNNYYKQAVTTSYIENFKLEYDENTHIPGQLLCRDMETKLWGYINDTSECEVFNFDCKEDDVKKDITYDTRCPSKNISIFEEYDFELFKANDAELSKLNPISIETEKRTIVDDHDIGEKGEEYIEEYQKNIYDNDCAFSNAEGMHFGYYHKEAGGCVLSVKEESVTAKSGYSLPDDKRCKSSDEQGLHFHGGNYDKETEGCSVVIKEGYFMWTKSK